MPSHKGSGRGENIEMEESERIEKECPGCGGNPLAVDLQHGRVVCLHCGLILREGLKDKGKFGTPLGLGR